MAARLQASAQTPYTINTGVTYCRLFNNVIMLADDVNVGDAGSRQSWYNIKIDDTFILNRSINLHLQ